MGETNHVDDWSLETAVEKYLQRASHTKAAGTVRMYRSVLRRWQALAQEEANTVGDLYDELAGAMHREVQLVTRGNAEVTPQSGHRPSASTRRLWASAIRDFWKFLEMQGAEALSTEKAATYMDTERHISLPDFPERLVDEAIQVAYEHAQAAQAGGETLTEIDTYLHQLRNYALIMVLRWTGMRVSEIVSLRRGDIDWGAKTPYAKVLNKGREGWVFFSPQCVRPLRSYLRARDAIPRYGGGGALGVQHLFVGHGQRNRGEALSSQHVWRLVRDLGQEAQQRLCSEDVDMGGSFAQNLHPHHLRHRFITDLWRESGDQHLVQRLARHASPTTTSQYTHATPGDLAERYRRATTEAPPNRDE